MNLQHDREEMLLAVQAAAAFTQTHGLAYAQISADLTIKLVSSNFYELLHLETAVTDQKITDLFPEFAAREPILNDILHGKLPHHQIEHFSYKRADNTTLFLDIHLSPLDPQNPQHGLLLLLEDDSHISQLRQTIIQERNQLRQTQQELAAANEKLRRLNRQKSLFLSVAAHDLRGPLSVIRGLTSLLQMEKPGRPLPHKANHLRTILLQSDRLNQMISDLLDLDRLEQGTLTIQPQQTVIHTLIEEVLDAVAYGQQSQGIILDIKLPGEPLVIEADADRLWRVIYNLVHNAIKYSGKNGQVIIEAKQNSAQEMLLRVQDNGIGMTPEEMDNLFSLYYRTDEAKKRGIKGTGLGLFIVKSMVEAHGGRVEVTSQPNAGSTFTIYLPITQKRPS